ncbi:MAG: type II secretion system GspH family protein [Planctomycetes bacterium]|nr:type II secretion system GspH family protein [Planctomycetota bacterium]
MPDLRIRNPKCRRQSPFRRARRGFTLLEVLATLAIMGIALTVLLVERNTAVKRTARAADRRLALCLAQAKLSEVLLGAETAAGGTFEEHPAFRWTAEEGVETVNREGGGSSQLRQVKVTVTFPLGGTEDKVALVGDARAP